MSGYEGLKARFAGCLLAGAVGDALGAPVEFLKRTQIQDKLGPSGITDFVLAYGRLGAITDDTQMTLFTAEGLLRAYARECSKGITTYSGVTAHAYLRWLATQGEDVAGVGGYYAGWLFRERALHNTRAPGMTCLSALRAMQSYGEPAGNDSKGCGGVMRVAPVGLVAKQLGWGRDHAFQLGCELAGLTHGHPTGQLTAGVLSVLVLDLVSDLTLIEALTNARRCLEAQPRAEETLDALQMAETLATESAEPSEAIAQLGEGWVAEEALAISLYCALVARSLEDGVVLAVNHDGDSDSTGAIAGNLLGAIHGVGAIPDRWLEQLELRETIEEIAVDLFEFADWQTVPYHKYPPS